METSYTKTDLENLEDRFEYEFALSFDAAEIPDRLVEMRNISFRDIQKELRKQGFSLILCIPHLPVVKSLKKAEVLQKNDSFKLLRVSAAEYTLKIEEYLRDFEYSLIFFWIRNIEHIIFDLPRTSQERIQLTNLNHNQIYSLQLENEECVIIEWLDHT